MQKLISLSLLVCLLIGSLSACTRSVQPVDPKYVDQKVTEFAIARAGEAQRPANKPKHLETWDEMRDFHAAYQVYFAQTQLPDASVPLAGKTLGSIRPEDANRLIAFEQPKALKNSLASQYTSIRDFNKLKLSEIAYFPKLESVNTLIRTLTGLVSEPGEEDVLIDASGILFAKPSWWQGALFSVNLNGQPIKTDIKDVSRDTVKLKFAVSDLDPPPACGVATVIPITVHLDRKMVGSCSENPHCKKLYEWKREVQVPVYIVHADMDEAPATVNCPTY